MERNKLFKNGNPLSVEEISDKVLKEIIEVI